MHGRGRLRVYASSREERAVDKAAGCEGRGAGGQRKGGLKRDPYSSLLEALPIHKDKEGYGASPTRLPDLNFYAGVSLRGWKETFDRSEPPTLLLWSV